MTTLQPTVLLDHATHTTDPFIDHTVQPF